MNKILSIKKVDESMKIKEIIQGQMKNSVSYNKKLNPNDFNDLARTLMDFEIQGYPIEKAIQKYKFLKKKDFPLW